MRSKLDVHIGAHRPGLTRENQAVLEIFGLEDVARCHVDLTFDDGGHARTTAAFPARMGHINARIEQDVDQGLGAWPTKPVPLTAEVYFDVRNLRHEQIVAHRRIPACSLTQ
jgi:hypothetical protein